MHMHMPDPVAGKSFEELRYEDLRLQGAAAKVPAANPFGGGQLGAARLGEAVRALAAPTAASGGFKLSADAGSGFSMTPAAASAALFGAPALAIKPGGFPALAIKPEWRIDVYKTKSKTVGKSTRLSHELVESLPLSTSQRTYLVRDLARSRVTCP